MGSAVGASRNAAARFAASSSTQTRIAPLGQLASVPHPGCTHGGLTAALAKERKGPRDRESHRTTRCRACSQLACSRVCTLTRSRTHALTRARCGGVACSHAACSSGNLLRRTLSLLLGTNVVSPKSSITWFPPLVHAALLRLSVCLSRELSRVKQPDRARAGLDRAPTPYRAPCTRPRAVSPSEPSH